MNTHTVTKTYIEKATTAIEFVGGAFVCEKNGNEAMHTQNIFADKGYQHDIT